MRETRDGTPPRKIAVSGRERRVERGKAPLVFATRGETGKKGEREREREYAVSRSANDVPIRVRAWLFFLTASACDIGTALRSAKPLDPPLRNLP
jgi:hypothetical protein